MSWSLIHCGHYKQGSGRETRPPAENVNTSNHCLHVGNSQATRSSVAGDKAHNAGGGWRTRQCATLRETLRLRHPGGTSETISFTIHHIPSLQVGKQVRGRTWSLSLHAQISKETGSLWRGSWYTWRGRVRDLLVSYLKERKVTSARREIDAVLAHFISLTLEWIVPGSDYILTLIQANTMAEFCSHSFEYTFFFRAVIS